MAKQRTLGTNRLRRAGRVADMRQLPRMGLIVFRGRGRIDGVMQPAVPAGRRHRGLGEAVVDDPAPLEAKRWVDLAAPAAIIGVAELIVANQLAVKAGVEQRVEGRAVPPGEPAQEKLFHPLGPLSSGKAPRPAPRDYGEAGAACPVELCVVKTRFAPCAGPPTRTML